MARKLDVQYVHYYTAGSAAHKVTTAFPAAKPVLPKQKHKKRKVYKIYIDPVATLGIIVAGCMLVLMAIGMFQLRQEQQQAQAMASYVDQLTQANEELRQKYKDSYDIQEVERTALALGMIPQEEAPRISISVELPQQEHQVTLWEKIGTFLTGLFA